MASNGLDIPLYCNICPKKPSFSDVSHLLTHIGSKGHLSNYYKNKVRAGTDAQARAMMQEYDQWYSDYDIEGLMSDRMNIKDKKKNKSKPSTPTPSAPGGFNAVNRQASNSSRQGSVTLSQSSYLQSPSMSHAPYDPRLAHVKREQMESSPMGSMPRHYMQNAYGNFTTPPGPRVAYGVVRRDSPYEVYPNGTPRYAYPEPPRYPIYPEPVTNGTSPNEPTTPQFKTEDDDNDLPVAQESTTGCATLKGVLWPGMDIFDSATPIAKRRRNQKKDESVLKQLEKNSEEVEPVEHVHWPDGSLKKKKEISGLPSSSSPFASPARPAWRPVLDRLDSSTNASSANSTTSRYNGYANDRAIESLNHGYEAQQKKRNFDVFQEQDETVHMPVLTRGLHDHEVNSSEDRHARRRIINYQNENARLTYGSGYIKREEHDGDYGFHPARATMSSSARLNAALSSQVIQRDHRGNLIDPYTLHAHQYHQMNDGTNMFTNNHGNLAHRSHGAKNRTSIGSIPVIDLLDGSGHPAMMSADHPFSHVEHTGASAISFSHGGVSNMTLAAPTPISAPANSPEWNNFWNHQHGTTSAVWAFDGPNHNSHANGHGPVKSGEDSVLVGDRQATKGASTPRLQAEGKRDVPASESANAARGTATSSANGDDSTITAPASPCAA